MDTVKIKSVHYMEYKKKEEKSRQGDRRQE